VVVAKVHLELASGGELHLLREPLLKSTKVYCTVQKQLTTLTWIPNQARNILSFKVVILSLGLNNIELKNHSLSEYFAVAVAAGFQRSSSSFTSSLIIVCICSYS